MSIARTVTGALFDSGELERVGGVPYLHTFIQDVPTAASSGYRDRHGGDFGNHQRHAEDAHGVRTLPT